MKTSTATVVLTTLLIGMVFALDLLTPLGIATGVCYLFVILVALSSPQRGFPLTIAAICSALVVVDFFLSPAPDTGQMEKVLANRIGSVVIIWMVALAGLWQQRHDSMNESPQSDSGPAVKKGSISHDPSATLRDRGERVLAWLNWLMHERTVLVLILLFVAAGGFLWWHQSRVQSRMVESIIVADARAYSEALKAFRTLYTSEVVSRAQKRGIEVAHDYREREGAIPLPATLTRQVAEQLGRDANGLHSKLYSPYPFKFREEQGGLSDQFARDAWDALNRDPKGEFRRVEEIDGRLSLRYATADLMRPNCVNCHNTHPERTRGNWKEGDVRGVLEVTLPLEHATAQTYSGLQQSLALYAMFATLSICGVTLVLGRLRRTSAELEQRVQERTSALEKEHYLLQMLMANLPHSIYFKDTQSRFLRVNPALAKRFGLSDPTEVVGKTDADFFTTLHAQQALADEREVIRTGQPLLDNEEVETWPDGSQTWVNTSKLPLYDRQGNIVGTFGISRDVTEQKRTRESLRQAKEAAEAASRAKSDFLANMSHEIRTPMNAIIGMTELVLDTELTTVQREYLKVVQESADSLLALLNDILDFSKIEAGKLDLENVGFDLHESLGDTMKSLALRAHRKGLELACHIAPEVPTFLVGDVGRLRQVAINLVGNAIKFTETGEVVLDVGLANGPGASEEVVLHFSVRDTGIGIPEEKLAAIFEAFEQVDSSTTRKYGGTGLGLTISTRLVELMGGKIAVESEVGKGSTFHFTTRLGVQPASERKRVVRKTTSVRGKRVLVVDDNATNRQILEEMLRNWELKPTCVASAPAALEMMYAARQEGAEFDLVLLDVNMPGTDGFTLAEQIKQDPKLSSTVIMMLTSGDRPGDVARCEELGVSAYLIKPIKQSELFNAILTALDIIFIDEEEPEPVAAELPPSIRPLHLLLAEDSVPNQKLAVGLLQKWGHRVTVVNNGKKAVEAVATQEFDVVLMDVQMPEMDGLEATATIRQQERQTGKHVPIIAMTAHAMKGDREQCLAAGMDNYVAKPVRAQELRQAIAGFFPPAAETAGDLEQDAAGSTPESKDRSVVPDSSSQETDASRSSILDWSAALATAQGDRNLLKSIAVAALGECPRLLEELAQAIANQDVAVVQRMAHTIKGTVRMFGATRTVEVAALIEAMGRQGVLEGVGEPFEELKQHMEKFSVELSAFTKEE